jgi:hypothetical protein
MSAMKRRPRPEGVAGGDMSAPRRNPMEGIKNPIEGFKKPIRGFKKFVTRRPAIEEVVHETTSGGVIFRHNPRNPAHKRCQKPLDHSKGPRRRG